MQLLESHRNDLRSYKDLINSVSHNAFGLTLHKIMWRAETHRIGLAVDEKILAQVAVSDATQISEYELSRRIDCLGHLGAQYSHIGEFGVGNAFWGFFPERIIPGDEVGLRELFTGSQEWSDRLATAATQYAILIGERAIGLSPESANEQLGALRAIINLSNSGSYLNLVPKLFAKDRSGEKARRTLDAFSTRVAQFSVLAPLVESGLRAEGSAAPSRLETLRQLERVAGQLGVTLGRPADIGDLCGALKRECDRLAAALPTIMQLSAKSGLPFDGSRLALNQLSQIALLVMEAPMELFHLQQAGLTNDGCHQALLALSNVQRECTELQAELDRTLYVDMLPSGEVVMRAIMALRVHRAWHRVFQRDWRAAVATHKRIDRSKKRRKTEIRLAHLEGVARLIHLRERWKGDPVWSKYLRVSAPTSPSALDDYIHLAKWNASAREILDAIATPVLSLADLTREKVRALRREFEGALASINSAVLALKGIDSLLPRIPEIHREKTIESCHQITSSFVTVLESQIDWLRQHVQPGADLSTCIRSCEAAIERQKIRLVIDSDEDMLALLGEYFAGVETDLASARAALSFGQSINSYPLPPAMRDKIKMGHPVEIAQGFHATLAKLTVGFSHISNLTNKLSDFGEFDLEMWVGRGAKDGVVTFADFLRHKVRAAINSIEILIPWSLYVGRRKEAVELGLMEFVDLLEKRRVPSAAIGQFYAYSTYATIIRSAFRAIPQLGKFSGLKHSQIRDEFGRLDREVIQMRGKAIASQCSRGASLPGGRNGARVDEKTEMVLLNYLLPQQRPRMAVRKMLSRAGHAIQSLKPCFMMGPQAVAQYLTPGAVHFDLVIMDEASQLKPEEAVGAIARGSQLVVVGDSKQLPPTSFFSKMTSPVEDDDPYTTTDAESILDVCSAHFHPSRPLRWHYRSQHHSLIAFSNHHFYRGSLIVFPSPYGQSSHLGVRATYLANAVYDNQTNLREAERVVAAVAEHITARPNDSLGVVTLNTKQRDLISELLEERLRSLAEADAYRERWMEDGQPLFVKNLENVQGDERDSIVISTTFGRPPGSSAVRQNFGPISRQGGWRRLNVLFTRARKSVALYTSMRPESIVVDGTTPEGTKALRNYLEYARTGSLTVTIDEQREPDSEFEVAVINVLQARGYEVTPQLGVAGFRIDIAVKHPEAPGVYLAAIECDGASYHSAQSVRDRDRIRQEILESLGWRGRIWRIWSTDWFRSPRQEAEKLVKFLEDIRETWKPEHSSGESWIEEGVEPVQQDAGAELSREDVTVGKVLVETDDDLNVQVGDLVRYADVEKLDDV
jgi:very-short-patch-repair endonuclease